MDPAETVHSLQRSMVGRVGPERQLDWSWSLTCSRRNNRRKRPDANAKLVPFSDLWGENSFYHLAKDHLRFLVESSL